MSRSPQRLLPRLALIIALFSAACGDDGEAARVDALDTSGLDGLPEPDGALPDVEDSSDTNDPDTGAPEVSPDVPPEDAVETDTEPTDTESPDTALESDSSSPDTAEPTDTVADASDTTDAPDTTGTTDTSEPPCECLAVGVGELGVVITNDGTSEPPTLGGLGVNSDPMSGLFGLDAITVYTKGAFDGVLISSATVTNDGETSGTVRFEDGRWAFLLDLDLSFNAQTALGPNSGGSRTLIEGGGCYTLDGNLVVGDTSDCANEWPSGTTPPATFEFAYDAAGSRFVLKVELTRAFVIALVPPEYELIANAAITGPIRFVAAFSPR